MPSRSASRSMMRNASLSELSIAGRTLPDEPYVLLTIWRLSPVVFSIIEQLRCDHPLEDLGDLTLCPVVARELHLELRRVVERPRGHIGSGRRVAAGLHPPLGRLAPQPAT